MQLSLSVSLPAAPDPAKTGGPAADAAPGASGQAGAGENSFAAMLPADKAPAGPAVPSSAPDPAKAAVILAPAGLMPGAQPGMASVLSPGGDAPAGDHPASTRPEANAVSNQVRSAGFFGVRSARTYAATGRTPVAAAPDADDCVGGRDTHLSRRRSTRTTYDRAARSVAASSLASKKSIEPTKNMSCPGGLTSVSAACLNVVWHTRTESRSAASVECRED